MRFRPRDEDRNRFLYVVESRRPDCKFVPVDGEPVHRCAFFTYGEAKAAAARFDAEDVRAGIITDIRIVRYAARECWR